MPSGVYIRKEYHIKRLSESHIGVNTWSKNRKISEEHRRKIIKSNTGRIKSEATRRKLSIANTGKHPTIETLKKLKESHLGQVPWNKNKKGVYLKKTLKLMSLKKKGCKNPHTAQWNEKIRKSQIGKKGNNWKNGITPINNKIRNSLEYKLWRKSVFERDNFTCQKYSISGGILNVHHINNFADFPELRFAIDNGITLSKKAHIKFHKKYGVRNNTKEQLVEFLEN